MYLYLHPNRSTGLVACDDCASHGIELFFELPYRHFRERLCRQQIHKGEA
jgi:hypothetical protein